MSKMIFLVMLFAVLGFLGVAVTGVDLASSRSGGGLVLLSVGVFLLSLRSLFRPSGEPGAARHWLTCVSLLGGGYFVVRAAVGGPVGLALPDVALVLSLLSVYFLVVASPLSGKRAMLWALVALCVANVVVAFFQKFGAEGFYVWKEGGGDSVRVVSGLFGHYNPFSGFLNGSVFIFATFAFFGKKLWFRVCCGLLVVGILAAVVFGGSRGGWVSLVVGAAVWVMVVLAYLKQRKSRAFGVALVCGILFTVIGLASSAWMVQRIIDKRAESTLERLGVEGVTRLDDGGRMGLQQLAFDIFQESPVLGMGPRSYSYLSLENWDPERRPLYDRPPEFVHNEYLQALVDYGLLGLLIVMALILVHAILGCYHALGSEGEGEDEELSLMQLGAMGGFVAILAQCFFSFLLHTPSCMVLLALLSGILASRGRRKEAGSLRAIPERFSGALGAVVAVSLFFVGGVLTQSYLLSLKANEQLAGISDDESAFRALATMSDAAHTGRDPEIFEIVGRSAMIFGKKAGELKDDELAKKFNLEAKRALEAALEYNPHSPAGIAGLPRIEDALGNWEQAEAGHELAMEKLWSREYRLRPYFYASQSAYASGLRAFSKGERRGALKDFRKASQRLEQRHELLQMPGVLRQDKDFILELEAWVLFLEGQFLFEKGDEVWKNERPRNPELGYGFMLEAQKRFQACEAVMKGKSEAWGVLVKQLEFNLQVLEGGRVRPVNLSDEEVAEAVSF